MLEITAAASTRQAAFDLMVALGLGTLDKAGHFVPGQEVQIYPERPEEELSVQLTPPVLGKGLTVEVPATYAPEWHFDLRVWGETEARWRKEHPAEEAQVKGEAKAEIDPKAELDTKYQIAELAAVAKATPVYREKSASGVPPGYEIKGVRFYPARLLTNRRHTWA
jgi:hypothetical protein